MQPPYVVAQTKLQVQRIDKLLSKLPHAQTTVSATIIRLPQGEVSYALNPDLPLIPASNQKVVTGAVALTTLDHEFEFKTRAFLNDANDLILVGGGDPGLGDPKLAGNVHSKTLAFFDRCADALKARSRRVIRDIIVVDDVFEPQQVHPHWEAEDLPKWYAAPVGGLNFFDNTIEVTLIPTSVGQHVNYAVFPPSDWISIDNGCKTGSKQPWIHRQSDGRTYSLRGECKKRVSLKPVSISDPALFTGNVLRRHLASRSISMSGQVRRSPTTNLPRSSQKQLIAEHATTIASVLQRSLGDSQNLFAEALLKMSDHKVAPNRSGSWKGGAELSDRMLRSWGIDTSGLVISDGSGLSRENRLTARQLARVMVRMYDRGDVGDLFIDSLALNGVRGTLRKRLKHLPEQVWGKTGYMRGIRTLSAFVRSSDQDWYVVAVLFNNIPGGTAPYTKIHDNICEILINGS